MGPRTRRLAFWTLLAAFSASLAWWTLSVPHDPQRLYRAIPADAWLVTEHWNLDARVDALLNNRLVCETLDAAGLESGSLRVQAGQPAVRRWTRRLLRRESVVAVVPGLPGSREPTLVFAAWIGGLSQRLRWRLALAPIPGLNAARTPGSQPTWWVQTSGGDAPRYLSMGLVEGMFLGCVAPSPLAVRHLVHAVEGRPSAPSVASARRARPGTMLPPRHAPDFGLLDWPQPRPPILQDMPSPVGFEISEIGPGALEVTFYADCALRPAPSLQGAPRLDALASVLRDAPQAVCLFPRSYVEPGRLPERWPAFRETVQGLLEAVAAPDRPATPLCVALCGERFQGSYHLGIVNLRIPMLLVAVDLGDDERALATAFTALDRLNAGHTWGLVPRTRRIGAHTLVQIESTRDNAYAQLPPGQGAAYAAAHGWLLLASHADALATLLEEAAAAPTVDRPPGRWLPAMSRAPAAGAGWVDAEALRATLSRALDVAALLLSIKDAAGTQPLRRRLIEARKWLARGVPCKTCTLWLDRTGQTATLRVRLEPS